MTDFLDSPELRRRILAALAEKQPFTAVRKGDGENIVIGYGAVNGIPWKRYRKKLRHFNVRLLDISFQLYLRGELIRSLNSCDVLGVAPLSHRHAFWSLEDDIQKAFLHRDPDFCDMNFHLEFIRIPGRDDMMRPEWIELFKNRKIGIVSHRDPSEFIEKCGGELVCRVGLPKRKDRFQRMTRNVYTGIMADLEHYTPSADLWFLAAGIYSLPFADMIRSRGGVAVDIGSSVDTWVQDYSTRGIHRKVAEQGKRI